MSSKGLGDNIERVIKATGIDKVVKTATKVLGISDCGCGKRRDKLNKKFPKK